MKNRFKHSSLFSFIHVFILKYSQSKKKRRKRKRRRINTKKNTRKSSQWKFLWVQSEKKPCTHRTATKWTESGKTAPCLFSCITIVCCFIASIVDAYRFSLSPAKPFHSHWIESARLFNKYFHFCCFFSSLSHSLSRFIHLIRAPAELSHFPSRIFLFTFFLLYFVCRERAARCLCAILPFLFYRLYCCHICARLHTKNAKYMIMRFTVTCALFFMWFVVLLSRQKMLPFEEQNVGTAHFIGISQYTLNRQHSFNSLRSISISIVIVRALDQLTCIFKC